MSALNIPGFYYDAEKQKYFKIQGSYKIPGRSVENGVARFVQQERARKRQKTERKRIRRLLAARPRLRGALRMSTLTGQLLHRELNLPTHANDDAGSMVAANFLLSETQLEWKFFNVNQAFTVPHSGKIMIQYGHWLERFSWDGLDMTERLRVAKGDRYKEKCNAVKLHVSAVDDYSTECVWVESGLTPKLHRFTYHLDRYERQSVDIVPQATNWQILDTACSADRIVVAQPRGLICLDSVGNRLEDLGLEREASCIEMLDRNVCMAGIDKTVRLWDTRTKASTARFKHSKRVTGLKKVGEDEILIADNYGIHLYDRRWTGTRVRNQYPVSFNGTSEGKLCFDIEYGLVAAYMDEQLKIFSLSSGKTVAAYEVPSGTPQWRLNTVSWRADARGSPYVQMCHNQGIYRFSMHGSEGDV